MKKLICSICGSPNVGKSTLLNALLNFNLAIASHKPQTTRKNLKGSLEIDNTKIFFIDTPGIFIPRNNQLERKIIKNAWNGIYSANLIILVVDNLSKININVKSIITKAIESNIEIVLFINKADCFSAEDRIRLAEDVLIFNNEKIINIFHGSAKKKTGCVELINFLKSKAKEDINIEEDLYSIKNEEIVIEKMREFFFLKLDQELPYSIHLHIDEIKENQNNITINIKILTLKESQKFIIIGKGGNMLKESIKYATDATKKLFPKRLILKILVESNKEWIEHYR